MLVDEHPLFVEPCNTLGIAGRDLINRDSPCRDSDRVAERDGLGEVGEQCESVETAVGDDYDIGGDAAEESEHTTRSRRQDGPERFQSRRTFGVLESEPSCRSFESIRAEEAAFGEDDDGGRRVDVMTDLADHRDGLGAVVAVG